MSDSLWPHRLYSPWNSPGQNTAVGSLSLLQGIFTTQGSNLGLLHCRRILYHLSPQGSPKSYLGKPNLGNVVIMFFRNCKYLFENMIEKMLLWQAHNALSPTIGIRGLFVVSWRRQGREMGCLTSLWAWEEASSMESVSALVLEILLEKRTKRCNDKGVFPYNHFFLISQGCVLLLFRERPM